MLRWDRVETAPPRVGFVNRLYCMPRQCAEMGYEGCVDLMITNHQHRSVLEEAVELFDTTTRGGEYMVGMRSYLARVWSLNIKCGDEGA